VPLGLYIVGAQLLTNLDLYALKAIWQGEPEVIGRYVAALNIARTLTVIPTVQSGVLFASLAWALAADDAASVRQHIQEATRFALVIALGALAVLSPDAGALMGLIFSDAYRPGGGFLVFQLTAFGGYALLDAFAHCLVVSGRQWLAATILLGMIPLIWLANLWLIPSIGPIGAAMSLALGVSVATLILGALTYRRFGSLIRRRSLTRVLAAWALTAGLGSLLPVSGPLLLAKLAAAGALYLGLLLWWGEITPRDLGFGRRRAPPGAPA
jgi:O-antigen/teichoic acid export membrane protein